MVWSRKDLFKRDNAKLEVYNPYMQGAKQEGDIQPLYWQKKPLEVSAYKSPSSAGDRRMDTVATVAGLAIPAWRLEEWVAAVIGKMMPAIQKLWPKVMARFGNLLTKAKGKPEALAKIVEKFWWDDVPGMMLRPSQLQKTNPNYLDNINAVSEFKSRKINEPSAKQKIDGWLNIRNKF